MKMSRWKQRRTSWLLEHLAPSTEHQCVCKSYRCFGLREPAAWMGLREPQSQYYHKLMPRPSCHYGEPTAILQMLRLLCLQALSDAYNITRKWISLEKTKRLPSWIYWNILLQQVLHSKGITLYCKLIVLGPILVNVVFGHLGLGPYFLIPEASPLRQKDV